MLCRHSFCPGLIIEKNQLSRHLKSSRLVKETRLLQRKIRKSPRQLRILKDEYDINDNPSPSRIHSISSKTSLSSKQIYKWFWERRKRAHGELRRPGTVLSRNNTEEQKVYDEWHGYARKHFTSVSAESDPETFQFESIDESEKKSAKNWKDRQSKSGADDILEYLESIMNSPDEEALEKPGQVELPVIAEGY